MVSSVSREVMYSVQNMLYRTITHLRYSHLTLRIVFTKKISKHVTAA